LNVAFTFNVKPEGEVNNALVSPFRKSSPQKPIQQINDVYAEWDTWSTINAVHAALTKYNDVTMIEADYDVVEKLKNVKPDIVFNIAEGFYGTSRESQIPAILDMLNIPYTGSDPLTLALSLDKGRTKEILSYHKIPTPNFFVVKEISELKKINFNFPLIVKPVAEGSSKGIFSSSFVQNKNELMNETERIFNTYNQNALIEEYLPGREFTVSIIGNDGDLEILPIVEISYKDFPETFIPIYSYEAKWILDTKENPLDVFVCPAKIDEILEEKIKSICLKTYNILRCRDWSRIDVRLDVNDEPNIIEINPLPGILPDPKENSCFPKAARTAGYDYNTMINKVLYAGCKRYGLV